MNLQKFSNKELRHLMVCKQSQLASITDINDNWIKILEAIPKDLNNIFTHNLDGKYERKYRPADADILRKIAQRKERSPSFMLLFEEWATSGRQRPTIQHLYELLISLPLFRAADYIAEEILHIQRPNRPDTGPARRIDITLPESGIDSNRMRDFSKPYCYPNTTSIENPEYGTNHGNQYKSRENSSSYNNKSIIVDSPRNQSSESSSNICSSLEPTNVTETGTETSEYNDTTKTDYSYTNKMPGDRDSSCLPIFEQLEVEVNMRDLSLLDIVS